MTELQNQEVQDGYPVSFDCIVIGKPLPTVRWFKDGKAIEENDHYMINEDQEGCHQLIITAVVPTDMGVYRCLAENSMGVASTKAELRVDCKSQNHWRKIKGRSSAESWLGFFSPKESSYLHFKEKYVGHKIFTCKPLGFCQLQGKLQSKAFWVNRGVFHNPGTCGILLQYNIKFTC